MPDMLRVYPAYIKGPAEKVVSTDEVFLKVWAALGVSRTEAINKIFQAGLTSVDLKGANVDTSSLAIMRKWQEKMAQVTRQGQLEYIYEHSTLDEFIEFCEENNIDHEVFLEMYKITMTSKPKSEVMAHWLKYLLADGEEYRAEDIREAAEIDKVVENDADWSLMKNVASKDGYSRGGKRGYWRKLKVS